MRAVNHILDNLNAKQIEAVTTTEGPVLVISGPGSGKTRALTHRIAHLIASGVPAECILAVTFTNRAALEIKRRVSSLLVKGAPSHGVKGRPSPTTSPTIGTFHALGLRILRRESEVIGLPRTFTILDTGDQQALMKRVLATLELDPKHNTPDGMLAKIAKLKTELVAPDEYTDASFNGKILRCAYKAYQNELTGMNAVDFGDLIELPVRLFRQRPDILRRYQERWQYILVDEYQDTSHDQYTLIGMLAAGHRNLFCIGDDAQSIYMFRQADIRNILNFQKDYPDGKIILLEQNYRSTKTILAAAQSIIANNKNQFPKELWTDNHAGEPIVVMEAISERDEAARIVETIRVLQQKNYALSDFAVLYRTHAQSRAIEEAFVRYGVPYQIVGGVRFYERKEIKDLMAYLRLIHNARDTVSLERIANVPPRGIGKATIECMLVGVSAQAARAETAMNAFFGLMAALRGVAAQKPVSALLREVITRTCYEKYLETPRGDVHGNAEERIENMRELLTVAKKYDTAGPAGLALFLEEVTLLQDIDKIKDGERAVTLMTMHAAKGLEFPAVFIAGMEEGLFPHSRTVYAPHDLEEERRLCYVAITRAKELLYITMAKWRRIFGTRAANIPSRFLGEMPEGVLRWHLLDMGLSTDAADDAIDYDE